MAIDINARRRLMEDSRTKTLVNGMKDSIITALKNNGSDNEEVLKLVVKREESQEEITLLKKLGDALAMIYKRIPPAVSFPKIQPISGKVKAEITNSPTVKVTNLNELFKYLQAIELRVANMATAISMIATQKPIVPEVKIPKTDFAPLITAIENIEVKGDGQNNEEVINALDRVEQILGAMASRPAFSTAPVTNVNINSLRGAFLASAIAVGTSATPLPQAALPHRRSIIVYNNSANTIYLGGSTVATAGTGQGIPVTAGSVSPAFDAGDGMTLYGIATVTSTVNILEMSNDNIGR